MENLYRNSELVYIGLCVELDSYNIKIPSTTKTIVILENTTSNPFSEYRKKYTIDVENFKRNGLSIDSRELKFFYEDFLKVQGISGQFRDNTCVIYFRY